MRFDLLLSHVLGYSEKYCFLRGIQAKHTVHRVHRGEGKVRVQNKCLINDRSIQKSDGSREEAVFELVGS